MAGGDQDVIKVVEKAIDLLEVLSRSKSGLSVSELAKSMGLPKTTVFRLLSTLRAKKYVEKVPNGDDYQLSVKVLALGTGILDRMDLRGVARPYIEELARQTKEVVHLAVFDAEEVVYIDKVESLDHPIRIYSQIGRRVEAHCTGLGKIFLSALSDADMDDYIARRGLPRRTATTITEPARLKRELADIRKKRYGIDESENEEGIRCVAAPIFANGGKTIGAISVSGPVIYVTKQRLPELITRVTATAESISRSLGFEA
jgi:IclR family acetate operon transcriptional repressor